MKRRRWGEGDWRGLFAAAIVLLAGVGCGVTPQPTESASPNAINRVLAELPQDVDPEQRSILERAAESGEVTYEQYSDAVYATIECVEALGIAVDAPHASQLRGLPALAWGWRQPEGMEFATADALIGDCHLRHSWFVEAAYSGQPLALEAEEQLLEKWRPELVACLRELGLEVDESASIYDLVDQSIEYYLEGDESRVYCPDEVGMHA